MRETSDSVDWLKDFINNFIHRRPSVPGGCPLLNTAVEADDANPVLRHLALKALRGWRADLSEVVKHGIQRKEIKRSVSPKNVADVIISSLEGALMMSRLEGSRNALLSMQSYLNSYVQSWEAHFVGKVSGRS